MEWDGTYLECTIENVYTKDGINYGRIKEYNIDCIYIKKKNLLPVIIDEIKYIFDIEKLGSRYNKKFIIYRAYNIKELWIEDKRLSSYGEEITYSSYREGRKILAFRSIIGLTSINERSILVRHGKLFDFNDINIHEFDEKISISARILKDWFSEIDINRVSFLMIKGNSPLDKLALVPEIRTKIVEVVERLDKRYLDLVSAICHRLLNIVDMN